MKKVLKCFGLIALLTSSNIVMSQTFTTYTTVDGVSDNYICGGVTVDGDNNIWVGTAVGVSKFDGATWTVYTTADGLIDNYITSIVADTIHDLIWVGTNLGVCKFDGIDWTSYTTVSGLIDNAVSYMYVDASGTVWFATAIGASKFDGVTWTSYNSSNGLGSDLISYITSDAANNKWFGTQMGGYSKYNNTSFTTYTTATIDSLLSDIVFALAIDDANNQWVGTWSGISKINASGIWQENFRATDGLYNNFVVDMKIDLNDNLWALCFDPYNTIGGISRFDGISWISFDVADGIADNQVIRLAFDQQNNVWIATGNGITKLSGLSGIEDTEAFVGQVFPNPATENVSILLEEQARAIRLMNTSGQMVLEAIPSSNQTNIETSDLAQGMYLIQVVFDDHISYTKLIIK